MVTFGPIAGGVLVALVLGQATAALWVAWRRAREQQTVARLQRERLALEVRAAQLRLQQAEQARLVWNGYRKFVIARKQRECEGVWSFRLEPHDRKPLPAFQPGQYLTFQLRVPGRDKPVVRCYSLSDAPNPNYYRVTIKREGPPPDRPDLPPGVASSFFCDVLKEGDIVDAKAPAGHFALDMERDTPVVLISAGVGVTPLLCMANSLVARGSKRECWFLFGARSGAEFIHRDEIERLRQFENFQVHVWFSRPRTEDRRGIDYQHEGRVTPEALRPLLPSNNYEFFLCGPGPFMNAITEGLRAWGVPDSAVHFEAFGPATVKKAAPAAAVTVASGQPAPRVRFIKSGKECVWQAGLSVLELAESLGIRIDAGCRAGSCGSCLVAIKEGSVEYLQKPEAQPEEGSCLTCICRPKTDLVLDA